MRQTQGIAEVINFQRLVFIAKGHDICFRRSSDSFLKKIEEYSSIVNNNIEQYWRIRSSSLSNLLINNDLMGHIVCFPMMAFSSGCPLALGCFVKVGFCHQNHRVDYPAHVAKWAFYLIQ